MGAQRPAGKRKRRAPVCRGPPSVAGNKGLAAESRWALPRQSPAVPASFRILGVTKMMSSRLSSRTDVVLNSQLR